MLLPVVLETAMLLPLVLKTVVLLYLVLETAMLLPLVLETAMLLPLVLKTVMLLPLVLKTAVLLPVVLETAMLLPLVLKTVVLLYLVLETAMLLPLVLETAMLLPLVLKTVMLLPLVLKTAVLLPVVLETAMLLPLVLKTVVLLYLVLETAMLLPLVLETAMLLPVVLETAMLLPLVHGDSGASLSCSEDSGASLSGSGDSNASPSGSEDSSASLSGSGDSNASPFGSGDRGASLSDSGDSEKGEVDVLSQDERSVMVTLKAGQYFGEGSLLFSEPRSTSIRASTNCDMYVLDKKDLDSTVKYYPDICKEIKDSAIAKREQLLKLKAQQLLISKMETVKNDKFDARFNQMYLKYMAEQELKLKYVALPLIVRMRTAFCQFYNDSLKKIIQLHNMTIDPEKTLRIILQYTSCLFIIISFWTITYMHYCFTGHIDELVSLYIYAVYWATATFTTTGYGDIRAVTYPEMWFCVLVMLLSKTLVGYNIGIISSMQTNKNSLQVSYEEKLQTIKNYMEEENIPPSLQQRVMQFYNYRWARTRGVDSDLLFSDTPSCMKNELFARYLLIPLKQTCWYYYGRILTAIQTRVQDLQIIKGKVHNLIKSITQFKVNHEFLYIMSFSLWNSYTVGIFVAFLFTPFCISA
ncbi:UNVERIFIED_CONTAM: hypothetical protein FKN15_017069 [Acipenser sinensis]